MTRDNRITEEYLAHGKYVRAANRFNRLPSIGPGVFRPVKRAVADDRRVSRANGARLRICIRGIFKFDSGFIVRCCSAD